MRRSFKDGVFSDLEPIPAAAETDSVTFARMTIREDDVVTVFYPNKTLFCTHADGTKFHTSADGKTIRIEK